MQNKRIFWLDIARVIAILLVTFNHAIGDIFTNPIKIYPYMDHMSITEGLFSAFVFIASRVGVPIFLMITGAIMLNHDYEEKGRIRHLYRHNILQLFIATQIILFLYFVILLMFGHEGKDIFLRGPAYIIIRGIINQMFLNKLSFGNMWYMPMILCVYMMIPIVSITLKRISSKYFLIPMSVILIITCVLQDINKIFNAFGSNIILESSIHCDYIFSYYLIFAIEGYYIMNGAMSKIGKKWLITIVTATFFISSIFQYSLYYANADLRENYNFLPLFIITPCCFELIHRIKCTNELIQKVITYFSRTAFALFIVHVPIFAAIGKIMHFSAGHHAIVGFIFMEIVGIALSYIVIYVLMKIKWISHYVFLVK